MFLISVSKGEKITLLRALSFPFSMCVERFCTLHTWSFMFRNFILKLVWTLTLTIFHIATASSYIAFIFLSFSSSVIRPLLTLYLRNFPKDWNIINAVFFCLSDSPWTWTGTGRSTNKSQIARNKSWHEWQQRWMKEKPFKSENSNKNALRIGEWDSAMKGKIPSDMKIRRFILISLYLHWTFL